MFFRDHKPAVPKALKSPLRTFAAELRKTGLRRVPWLTPVFVLSSISIALSGVEPNPLSDTARKRSPANAGPPMT